MKELQPLPPHLHVVLEHVGSHLDADHVVDHQLAEAGQEVPALVQLLDLHVLVHIIW